MALSPTSIEGTYAVEPQPFADARGYRARTRSSMHPQVAGGVSDAVVELRSDSPSYADYAA